TCEVTELGLQCFFRAPPVPAPAKAEGMADSVAYAGKARGKPAKTVATVYETTDGVPDVTTTLRRKFKEQGLAIVLDEGYPPNSPDLRPLVLKIKGRKPDVVTVTSYAADAVQLHKLLAQMRVSAMGYIGSAGGQIDSGFLPQVGKATAKGV